jgi:hypothetical protein
MTTPRPTCRVTGHATAQVPARRRRSTRPARCAALLAVTALSALVSTAAQAAFTVFDERGDFLAATLQTDTESFDGWVKDTSFHSSAIDVGAFTLSMTAGADTTWNLIDVPEFVSTATHLNGTAHLMVFTDFGDALTFSFDQAITAFGADFREINDHYTRTLAYVGGQTLDIPGVPGGSVRSFFGFVSDTPFTSVSFRGVANDVYGIDDVTFGAALRVPAVPEPGSVALLSLGLVGVAVARRRATARAGTASTPV